MYNQYLSTAAQFPVHFSSEPRTPSPKQVIYKFRQLIEEPEPRLFDDLYLLTLESLEKHFNATFVNPEDAIWTGPTEKVVSFEESIFHQMMVRDQSEILL